jgi:hypothetical protein
MSSPQQLSHRALEDTGQDRLPPWWDFDPIEALSWDRLAVRGDRLRLLVWAWLHQQPEATYLLNDTIQSSMFTIEDVVAALQRLKAVKVVYRGLREYHHTMWSSPFDYLGLLYLTYHHCRHFARQEDVTVEDIDHSLGNPEGRSTGVRHNVGNFIDCFLDIYKLLIER